MLDRQGDVGGLAMATIDVEVSVSSWGYPQSSSVANDRIFPSIFSIEVNLEELGKKILSCLF